MSSYTCNPFLQVTVSLKSYVFLDNGPQYSSQKFAKEYMFVHRTSSPKYTQSNGEAEKEVQTVKMLLNKAEDPYHAPLTYIALHYCRFLGIVWQENFGG